MANEYRTTAVALEVLEAATINQRVTSLAVEVSQVDSDATDIRASLVGLEVSQVDDDVTDIKASLVGLEVLRTIGDAAPGVEQELAVAFLGEGLMGLDLSPGTGLRVAFTSEGRLGLIGLEVPGFVCTVPETTTWARATPATTTWARTVAETTTWVCAEDVVVDSGIDLLAYVNDDTFAFVDGDHLKLIG